MENDDLNKIGRIHSIETFGAVDGPGIRFIVFLQGCSLKCKYCHNRDTWDIKAGEEITVKELIEKIQNYKNYMIASGGGVTVSGGEPLLQVNFVISLFKELKRLGISTCVDTSGNFELTDTIKKLIELTDLFLLDIKCINDEIAKNLTGFSNKKELAFAEYLSDIGKDIWIRQVLVPGYTDNPEDLKKLKEFISSLKTVKKVEILPYHDMGKYKWEKLGCKYELDDSRPATLEDVRKAQEILGI